MAKVLVAGGTGLLGKKISQLLKSKGYEVTHLSRKRNMDAEFPAYKWNLAQGYIDEDAFEGVDYVINLAGASIVGKKWTDKRKKLLINSRVDAAAVFARYIIEDGFNPKAYISASAIGIYGNRSNNELLTEESGRGEGFLADCTIAWEKAIVQIQKLDIRTVGLRIGIVLAREGGALEQMMQPYKFKMGNWFGEGYYSWVHEDDIARMFLHALENEKMQGFYNAVAPNPCTKKELAYAIKQAKGGSHLMMPVPEFAIRLALGEMADVVMDSAKVSSEKIISTGFAFQHTEVQEALEDLLN